MYRERESFLLYTIVISSICAASGSWLLRSLALLHSGWSPAGPPRTRPHFVCCARLYIKNFGLHLLVVAISFHITPSWEGSGRREA